MGAHSPHVQVAGAHFDRDHLLAGVSGSLAEGCQGLPAVPVLLLEDRDVLKSGLFQLLAREQQSWGARGEEQIDTQEFNAESSTTVGSVEFSTVCPLGLGLDSFLYARKNSTARPIR